MSFRYLKSLLVRGASLQQAIDREESRPQPDRIRLLQLKKLRLQIKDRLYRLARAPSSRLQLAPAKAGGRPSSCTPYSRSF